MNANLALAQSIYKSPEIEGYQFEVYNVKFDSASSGSRAIPLKFYGLKKYNYSVLVKVRLEGDTTLYPVPGTLPSGDRFKFVQKVGNRLYGDTIILIHRSGRTTVVLSEIKILAFRQKNRKGGLKPNNSFTKFILDNYVSGNTSQTIYPETYFVAGSL